MLQVTGVHLSGKSNADVKGFHVISNHGQFNRILKGIEHFFPNLIGFSWQQGNLSAISTDDFSVFPALQEIQFYNNRLVSLDGDLFRNTPKLIFIRFDYNHLEHVGFGLLDGLNNLTYAYFNGNPCIDMRATTPDAIQDLKLKLIDQCQPFVTTESSTTVTSTTTTISTTIDPQVCAIGCVGLIETLQGDVESQSEVIVRQSQEISQQADEIARQREEISRQNEENIQQSQEIASLKVEISEVLARMNSQAYAITELEKQMREIWSSPCSPCIASAKPGLI